MRKIISLMIALFLFIPHTAFAEYSYLCTELGLLENYEDGSFRGEMYTTNAEFMKALGVLSNLSEEELIKSGYIRDVLNEKEPLKFDNLVYAGVKLLGYPGENYLKSASESGMYKNISASEEYITRENFAQCVYNILTTEKFNIESIHGDKVVLSKNGNMLKDVFNVERVVGIVSADKSASLNGNMSLNEGEFIVNNVTVRSDINTMDYFGRRVEVFVRMDEKSEFEGELVFIKLYRNDEVKVTSEYIDGATSNSKLVWLDYGTGKIKNKKIPPDTVVVRNNICLGSAKTLASSVFTPSDGEVNLIDNDSDGVVDVIVIWDYVTYITDHVNVNNEIIYDKTGRSILLKDRKYVIYNEKGNRINLSDIKPMSVLSVADNSDELIIISSDKEPVSGVYRRDGYEVEIGNDRYSLNGYCYLNGAADGNSVKAYLDKYNRVAYVVKDDEYKYGFLTKIYYSDEDGESLTFKMYTFDEGVVKKEASDSVAVINVYGKAKYRKNKDYKVLYDLISSKQELVKYKTNSSGKIRELCFTISKIGYDFPDKTDELEAYYGISAGESIKSREAKYIQNKFVSKYIVTPETLILSLEKKTSDHNEILEAEDFRRITVSDFTDDYDYFVKIYDVNEKFEAGIVIVDKIDDWYTKLGSIVENVSYTLDEYGEECMRIDIYTGGEKSYILSDNPDMKTDSSVAEKFYNAGTKLSEIKVGDVIYYKLDNHGKISAFAILHKNNNSGFYHRSNYGWGGNYIPNATMAVTYFSVLKTYSDLIIGEIDGARPIGEYQWRNYYIVENGKLRKAEFSDVKPLDKVVGLWKWSNLNDLIIYR